MSQVRVLELIKSLSVGGAEKLLVERLSVTDLEAFNVNVGYLDPARDALRDEIERLGVPVLCLNGRRRHSIGWMIRLRRHLLRQPVDVVHVHSPLMAVGVRTVLRTLTASSRPRLVSTEHSVRYHPLTSWLDRMTVSFDDAVIAVSGAVAQAPVAVAARGRVVLVHHGVNRERAADLRMRRRQLARDLGLPEGRLIACVANYRPEKDLATLLRAANLVHASLPDVQFVLVGSGPEGPALRRQIDEQKLAPVVHLLGHLDDAIRVTSCADVFALTSVREGLPVAVMEAIACGVPVVATRVGGLPDVVLEGRTGALADVGDEVGIARAIVGILSDRDRYAVLSAGALEHSANFDIRSTAREVEGIYRQLVHG